MPGLSLRSKPPNSITSLVLVRRTTNTTKSLVDGSAESLLVVRLNYEGWLMAAAISVPRKPRPGIANSKGRSIKPGADLPAICDLLFRDEDSGESGSVCEA